MAGSDVTISVDMVADRYGMMEEGIEAKKEIYLELYSACWAVCLTYNTVATQVSVDR